MILIYYICYGFKVCQYGWWKRNISKEASSATSGEIAGVTPVIYFYDQLGRCRYYKLNSAPTPAFPAHPIRPKSRNTLSFLMHMDFLKAASFTKLKLCAFRSIASVLMKFSRVAIRTRNENFTLLYLERLHFFIQISMCRNEYLIVLYQSW